MERNRRIAKAYARKRQLTINGSEDEYLDGTTLGLNSFDNPDMDSKTRHIKQYIGQGLVIRITKEGDILVKRLSEANVFVHRPALMSQQPAPVEDQAGYACASDFGATSGECYGIARPTRSGTGRYPLTGGNRLSSKASVGDSGNLTNFSSSSSANNRMQRAAARRSNALGANYRSVCLEQNKVVKIFDINKFKRMLERESKQAVPNRNYLQNQCISVFSFVVDDKKLLNLPSWIMIINIVALDLFRELIGGFWDVHFSPSLQQLSNVYLEDRERQAYDGFDSDNEEIDFVRQTYLDKGNSLVAASKRAFAKAAAKGAYNDENRDNTLVEKRSDILARPTELNAMGSRKTQPPGNNLKDVASKTNIQAKDRILSSQKSSENELPVPSAAQQSSSSSGFDSHCSSQHADSSASSSDSNLAPTSSPGRDATARSIVQQTNSPSVLQAVKKLEKTSDALTGRQVPRGKRPAKLPHRLNAHLDESFVSAPIEIPPPPGELAAKANLILVSPTGLSPTKHRAGAHDEVSLVDFKTIKHIDEQGKCKILYNGHQHERSQESLRPKQVPAGIPAHAQLAPPATQRHILRYLMSVSKGRLTEAKPVSPIVGHLDQGIYHVGQVREPTGPLLSAANYNNQRPLPFLPIQNRARQALKMQLQQHQLDESLYYRGLQARISSGQARPHALFPVRRQVLTNSQAQAMNGARRELEQFRNHNIEKFAFGNHLAASCAPAKPMLHRFAQSSSLIDRALSEQSLKSFGGEQSDGKERSGRRNLMERPQKSGGSSFALPLAKLFKGPNGCSVQQQLQQEAEVDNRPSSSLSRGKRFTSADDLLANHSRNTQRQQQTSVWNQLGLAIDSSFRNKLSRRKSKSNAKLTTNDL